MASCSQTGIYSLWLFIDFSDPWQVVPGLAFTPYDCLLIPVIRGKLFPDRYLLYMTVYWFQWFVASCSQTGIYSLWLFIDFSDLWQVVPRQVFTPYDCLLISVIHGKLFLDRYLLPMTVYWFQWSVASCSQTGIYSLWLFIDFSSVCCSLYRWLSLGNGCDYEALLWLFSSKLVVMIRFTGIPDEVSEKQRLTTTNAVEIDRRE